MNIRKCPRCFEVLPITEFGKDKHSHSNDGISYYCKKCTRAKAAEYRTTDCYKVAHKKYRESGQAQDIQRRYRKTPKGESIVRRQIEKQVCWNNTPEGKRKNKASWLQRRYGLSEEHHYQMWVNQKGKCDLCGKPIDYEKVQTEHNHISNALRGLTCRTCNLLLGYAYVDECGIDILEKAINYVKRHERID
jgi:hypothetical protein